MHSGLVLFYGLILTPPLTRTVMKISRCFQFKKFKLNVEMIPQSVSKWEGSRIRLNFTTKISNTHKLRLKRDVFINMQIIDYSAMFCFKSVSISFLGNSLPAILRNTTEFFHISRDKLS
ncbi:hypothetical protein M758_9G111400 [Ceratodon purpureus]|nr:hypothetical protein M758_9G111400 [Ceratodon purpureus]